MLWGISAEKTGRGEMSPVVCFSLDNYVLDVASVYFPTLAQRSCLRSHGFSQVFKYHIIYIYVYI